METVAPVKRRYSIAEYVEFNAKSEIKHEFHDGEILAMSGGTIAHSDIGTNTAGALRSLLRGGPCRVNNSDLRVRVVATRRLVYPDATVVCGPRELDPDDPSRQTVINPTAIFEVLSASSDRYDRGEKFDHYRLIGSLKIYVLVHQAEPRVEMFSRTETGWHAFDVAVGIDASITLPSVGVTIPLREIYEGVEFPPLPGPPVPEPNSPEDRAAQGL